MAESATAEYCLGAVVVQRRVATGSELSDWLMRSQQFTDVCWFFCRHCFISQKGDLEFDSSPDWQPVELGENWCYMASHTGASDKAGQTVLNPL